MKIRNNIRLVNRLTSLVLALSMFVLLFPLSAGIVWAEEPEEWLPVGDVQPLEIIQIYEDSSPQTDNCIVETSLNSVSLQSYAASTVPGGTRYGYDWLANTYNTDSATRFKLLTIYDALLQDAESAYANTNGYTQYDANNYYNSRINLSALNIPYTTGGSLIGLAISVFSNDNPQYYMFSNASLFYNNGSIYTNVALLIDVDYNNYETRRQIQARMEAKYQEYVLLVSSVTSDYDKIRLVHDKMLAEWDYSYRNGSPNNSAYAHNIVGVLDNTVQGPVCEAYAEGLSYILHRLGIGDAITIVGMAKTGSTMGGHAWNAVKINGKYYYIDSTWNNRDNTSTDPGNRFNDLYYKYFLVGSANTDFGAGNSSNSTHWAAGTVNTSSNPYKNYELPVMSTTDYVPTTNFSYLTDNGLDGDTTQTAGDNKSYVIGKSNTFSAASKDQNPVLVGGNYNYGPFVFASNLDVSLYKWSYPLSSSSSRVQLVPKVDYYTITEAGAVGSQVRVWLVGTGNNYRGVDFVWATASANASDATIMSYNLGGLINGTLGTPSNDYRTAIAGEITLRGNEAINPAFSATLFDNNATVQYAYTSTDSQPSFGVWNKRIIENGSYVWIKVTAPNGTTLIYKTRVTAIHPLIGTPIIDKTSPRIGDALTASLVGGNNTGVLSYQWKVGGVNAGTDSQYFVKTADLGKAITVTIKSSVETGDGLTSLATSYVMKKAAPAAPAKPTVSARTNNSITLTAINGGEYSQGGINWQSSTHFTGFSAETSYTFYQRIAETNDTYNSAASLGISASTTASSSEGGSPGDSSEPNDVIVSFDLSDSEINRIISNANNNIVKLDASTTKGATGATVPTTAIKKISSAGREFEIVLPQGNLRLDSKTLAQLADIKENKTTISIKDAKSSLNAKQLAAVGVRPVYNIAIQTGNKYIHNFNGIITVTIPYELRNGEKTQGISVHYINESGGFEEMESNYDSTKRMIAFKTSHFSNFVISYSPFPFVDVLQSNWFYNDVRYVYDNDIFSGEGEKSFAPYSTTTRGMVATVLWRLAGSPMVANEAFADVLPGRYYENAIKWGAKNGIMHGVGNNMFNPDKEITRQELATLIARYSDFIGAKSFAGQTDTGFADENQINNFALEAVARLSKAGIITGRADNKFDPLTTANRAEFAAIVHRLLKSIK